MEYGFLVKTYSKERLKTLNVWSMFEDEDLTTRAEVMSHRERNPLEHMIHRNCSPSPLAEPVEANSSPSTSSGG